MPHQGQRVLTYSGDTRIMVGQYFRHEPGVHDGDSGFSDENGDDIFPVTHWQPLPSPPGAQ
ncbi:DUF551 domain-containing protein [Pseudomonas plecoglossicida]|uniref:DUF551 domain-containing protein n=2 Tax=Pseudomonas TaxID=286 RepID=UPI000C185AD4|nr:hypothetical protein CQW31_29605 [Pseudomonas sp. 382]PLU99870.1 DUF551 domain-containing protein [Pseudomonas plecoglossicida]PLV09130.1 DUF551 domain-containing protein [Pseudomonas plecoglossicida]